MSRWLSIFFGSGSVQNPLPLLLKLAFPPFAGVKRLTHVWGEIFVLAHVICSVALTAWVL